MSSVDDRIVNMEFNNKQFTQGVTQTERDLTSLEKTLARTGKSEGLSKMGGAAQQVTAKFSALQVAGVAAIATIASKATMMAGNFLKSFTLAPLMQGFDEYNTNLQSIQTVMANTGASVNVVNGYMSQLNQYSDKTIYNFSEMARNIGTFTAAGVGLKDAVSSIQGISNMAALSGSTSQQASSAMYQLSQAIAAGRVSLQDWNSVVNAGMGGKNLQKALITTGMAMGQINEKVDLGAKNIKIAGKSFRESISTAGGGASWLTSDVLVKTFALMDGRLSQASIKADHLGWSQKRVTKAIEEQQEALKKQGYSDAQIKEITDMADRAYESATVVKTLPQLLGVVKESLGSVWAQAFQGIIGNFNQSKKLWTSVSNSIGDQVRGFGHSLVGTITAWRKAGGRRDVLTGLEAGAAALGKVLGVVKDAFRDIFPPMTGKQLAELSSRFAEFMSNLMPAKSTLETLSRIFRGFFAAISIGWQLIKGFAGVIGDLFGELSGGASGFLEFAASIGDMLVNLDAAMKKGDGLKNFFDGLSSVLSVPLKMINAVAEAIFGIFGGFDDAAAGAVEGSIERVGDRLSPLAAFAGRVHDAFIHIFDGVTALMEPVLNAFSGLGTAIGESLGGGDGFSGVLDVINTGLLGGITFLLSRFLKNGLNLNLGVGGSSGFFSSITESFGALTGTMEAMQAKLKADALLRIAGAVALLTVSIVALSLIDSNRLTSALVAMSAGFGLLLGSMAILDKVSSSTGFIKMPFITASLILLAGAILVLSAAVVVMSRLSWEELGRGLTGVAGALGAIALGMRLMPKGMVAQAAALMILAVALNAIAGAVMLMASMSWEELARGLGSMAAALVGIALGMRLMPKGMLLQAAALLVLSGALNAIALAMAKMGSLSWESIAKGVVGIAGAIAAVGLAMRLMPKGMLLQAGALVLIGIALGSIGDAIAGLGNLSWEAIGKGMVGIGGALLIIAGAMQLMPATLPITAAGLVLVGFALQSIGAVLESLGGMSWDEIAHGLVALGGALIVIAAGVNLMSGAIGGAAALVIVAGALAVLTPVLLALGNMSWEEIVKGLAMLAGVFAVLGLAGLILGPVVPIILALGAAMFLLGAGLALAGAGMLAFSVGFAMLTATGVAGIAVLSAAIGEFIDAIPKIATAMGEGFVAFLQTIGNNAPKIKNALVKIIKSGLQAVQELAPEFGKTITVLIDTGLGVIEKGIPRYAKAGMRIINGLLEAAGEEIPKIVDTAGDLIAKFITAMGDQVTKIANAGADMIVAVLDGLSDAIENKGDEIRAAAKNLATTFVDEIRETLWDMIPNIPLPDLPSPGGIIGSVVDKVTGGGERRAAGGGKGGGSGPGFSRRGGDGKNSKNNKPAQSPLDAFLAGVKEFSTVFTAELTNVANAINGAAQLLVGKTSGHAFDLITQANLTQRGATAASTTADVQDKFATKLGDAAQNKMERADNLKKGKKESKKHFRARQKADRQAARADIKAANKARTIANATAKRAETAQAQADAQREQAMIEVNAEKALKGGDYGQLGEIRSQQAQDLAANSQAMMASAEAKAAEAARIAKTNKNQATKLRKQAAAEAAEAQRLATAANTAQQQAINAYGEARRIAAASVTARMSDLRKQQQAEAADRKWQEDYDKAAIEGEGGKIAMLEARITANEKTASTAQDALLQAYAESDALQARITAGGAVSEAELAAIELALSNAEKNAQLASNAANQIDQDKQTIEQLRDELKQANASGGTTSGAQILPSRTALEDAALAVDRYTASVAQAEELAMSTAGAPQFIQNNYSPAALSPSEVYRQTKNLVSAAEIKMGAPTS